MVDIVKCIRIERKTTATISEAEAAKLLREAVGAPADAEVTFDCGFEYLRGIQISWAETEESDDAR